MIAPVRILQDALKESENREIMFRREEQHENADREMREVLEIREALSILQSTGGSK